MKSAFFFVDLPFRTKRRRGDGRCVGGPVIFLVRSSVGEVNMGVFKWLNSMVYGRYKMI
jgi:hypothetical protein